LIAGLLAAACSDARHVSCCTKTVDRSRFLTGTDESANGIQSQVAPSGAARADDCLKEEETE
jgi:hypothetical protein